MVLTATRFDPVTGSYFGYDDLVYREADGSTVTIASFGPGEGATAVRLSPDGSRVFFDTEQQLLPQDDHEPGSQQLYEWTKGGGLKLAALDSSGREISHCGAVLAGMGGLRSGLSRQDVSEEGSRLFFLSPDPSDELVPETCRTGGPSGESFVSDLYLRERGSATDISRPPAGVPDYGANFIGSTPDGSKVFFVTESALTPDKATEGGGHADIYRYDVASHGLTRISVGAPGYDDADVSGGGSNAANAAIVSADGSHVYFTAVGQLVPGQGATREENEIRRTLNLYLWVEGRGISYLVTLQGGVSGVNGKPRNDTPSSPLEPPVAAVNPDGSALVFASVSRLTSYDNEGLSEIYHYDASIGRIACVSCSPAGAPPNGTRAPVFHTSFGDGAGGLVNATPVTQLGGLSDDGSTVVFASADQLLPTAVNDAGAGNFDSPIYDIYDWHLGNLSLISTGTSPSSDYLLGASPRGEDVFFLTHEQLSPQDGDHAADIYDAHIGAGVPVPTQSAPCVSTETCLGPSSFVPGQPGPATSTFNGPGNPKPKPTRHHHRKKRHKKHRKRKKANRHHGRTTQANHRSGT